MNQKYYWIGGSTGSTLADRFDWNVAGNWRTVTYSTPWSEPIIQVATEVPSWNDSVYVGGLFSSSQQELLVNPTCIMATSPLLFGGFSGDASNGGWTAGSYSNTGTTWTSSLRLFSIAGSGDFASSGATFSYPFSVIGGGINNGTLTQLKLNNVIGMTATDWNYIALNGTTRQKQGLKLKSNYYDIRIDGTINQVSWTPGYRNYLGVTQGNREVYLEAIDVHTTPNELGNLSFLVFQSLNTKLHLNNSKIQQLLYSNPFITTSVGPDPNLWERNWRNQDRNWIYVTNSTIETIDLRNWINVTIDSNCLIGQFTTDSVNWAKQWIDIPPLFWAEGAVMNLGGTYSPEKAAKAMRPNPNLSGMSLLYGIDIDLQGLTFKNSYYDPKTSNVKIVLSDGITLNADNIRIYGPNGSKRINDIQQSTNYWYDDKRIKIVIGTAVITQIEVSKAVIWSGWAANPFETRIRSFYLTNESTLDFSRNPDYTGWKFGEITNTNYSGGLYCSPATIFDSNGYSVDHSAIIGGNNQTFVNYAVLGDRNTRSGVKYTGAEQYVYIPPR